jgi:hypothetical protein
MKDVNTSLDQEIDDEEACHECEECHAFHWDLHYSFSYFLLF